MLTPKQEKFVQNIVKGMSQREAYKKSYNAKKMKDASIDTKAWELMQKVEIKERYEELISKLDKKAIMTAQERMEWLTNVLKDIQKEDLYANVDGEIEKIGSKNADLTTKLKAMDILNKMSGEYVTKVDANVNSDVNISIELTDDE